MLTLEEAVTIEVLKKQGRGLREIARELGVSRNTVRKYLRDGKLPQYKPRPARPTKLDAFEPYLRERLAVDPKLQASVLCREIRERGYAGAESMVRVRVAALKPRAPAEPVVRFETEPGRQLQVDYAEFRCGDVTVYAFVATLGFSRRLFVRFVDSLAFESLRDCQVAAFDRFGGVPHEVLYDNMRTVVLQRNAYGVAKHRFHPGLWALARDYGFTPRLCRPYRAQTKGKVERAISYLRRSFFAPFAATLKQHGQALTLEALNAAAERWVRTVADVRKHRTTGEAPAVRFERERTALLPLPRLVMPPTVRETQRSSMPVPRPSEPLQRPLAAYDAYSAGVSA
jgi:excisionase family DNA binding protein